MEKDILIKADGVSKKFCKDLKKSLKYGVVDLFQSFSSREDHGEVKLREGEFWAVRDVNFQLKRGECLGLIGHNGAGKSTLLKMLNGLIKPDEGSIEIKGRVGALIELGAGFNPILTGRENIYNNGAVLGFSKKEIDAKLDAIIEFSEIGEFIDSPVQNYSSGMKVRLGFAVAAQMEPDVLIIDEVLAVGDVGFRFKCLNAIGEIIKNAAVIFVSHSMPQVYRICTEVMLMQKGKVLHHSQEIGRGVELYLDMFSNGETQIMGTGEARVTKFELSTNEEESSYEGNSLLVPHGADLNIKMTLELDMHVPDVSVQLVVWNQDLLPVIDVLDENLTGYILNNNRSGVHQLELNLFDLKLNSGKHAISVIVNSPEMDKHYCRIDNLASFTMSAQFASGAHILLPSKWNQISENQNKC